MAIAKRSYYSLLPSQMKKDTALSTEDASKRAGTQSNQSSSSKSSQASFSGIADPESFQLIKGLLNQMANGGTEGYKKAQGQKDQSIASIDSALTDYSKSAAFTDAAALTQQSLNKAMEAQKPAIQKAIEGSGTSAGSMQALLSQKLASEASLAAGALGAEQAKAYGQISTNLLNNRGALTTGKDDSLDPITKLAELLKVSSSQGLTESSNSGMSNFNPMSNPYATTKFSTGPTVQDTVAGTGIAGGPDLTKSQDAYWASINASDALARKKSDEEFAAGTVRSGYNPYNSYVNI